MRKESRPTWVTLTGVGKCPVLGKDMYTDKRTAKRMKRVVSKELKPFHCVHCQHFHVGHGYGLTRAEHRQKHEDR